MSKYLGKKFKVVRSSAGSGKTYTLVKHYLLIVFRSSDPRYFKQLLAITFTNKATAEMKDRLLSALHGISQKTTKYKKLTAELAEELKIPKQEIQSKAQVVLNHLIHDYADFSISTIDRFVYKIIRSFSFELNLPAGLEIELDRDRILQKSIDALFDRLTEESELVKIMVDFAEYKFSSEKSMNIEYDLLEMAKEVINERTEPFLNELEEMQLSRFTEIKSLLNTRIKTIEAEVRKYAKSLKDQFDMHGFEASDLAGGSKGVYAFVEKLCGVSFELKSTPKVVEALLEGGKWKSSKIDKSKIADLEIHEASFVEGLKALVDAIKANTFSYNFCSAMLTRIYSMALVNEIHREIHRYKTENEILQLDDFNSRIAGIIDENPVPYIYERMGERYKHYLIDEFQDTSKIQWYNLIPLLENGLSEGKESLVVGDVKQAIYRWRGGDAGQMSSLPALNFPQNQSIDLQLREEVLRSAFDDKEVLDTNYRSSEAVVHFVNDFFEIIKTDYADMTQSIYFKHDQDVHFREVKGSVEIKFLEKNDELRLEEIKIGIDSFRKLGYDYGDMAILCRKKDQCSLVAKFLIQHDIPVISSESLKLSSSPEVKFLVHWLRYLADNENTEHVFTFLQYLVDYQVFESFDNDALIKAWKSKQSLKDILAEYFPDLPLDFLGRDSMLESISILARTFLGIKASDVFVLNFIDHLLKFQNKWGNDLIEFLSWWDDRGAELNVEMPHKNDSVGIMTIHKAKGLEFKVVVIPFMYDLIKAGEKHFWVHTREEDKEMMPFAWLSASKSLLDTRYADIYTEEMERSFIDTLNLMYVAMTRAANHLLILSETNNTDNEWREDQLLKKCFSLNEFNGSEDEGLFFRGIREEVKEKAVAPEEDTMLFEKFGDFRWRNKIQLKYRIDNHPLTEKEMSPREFGNLIHDLLSGIKELIELPEILRKYELRGLISENQSNTLFKNVAETLSNPEVSKFYHQVSGRVYNERDLLSRNGQIYRPDRMIIAENEVTIIDYKTGLFDASHEEQVNNYISVLNEIGKYKISAYLIYFASNEIRKVA